ncbi:MAG TPA: quinoprotein dehydrogenase-associated putative ABC transporter substrate-binding protein [Trueperaceae bacterium]
MQNPVKPRGRKSLAVVRLLITLVLVGAAYAQNGQWELRVCADPASLPFSSQDETGYENRIAEILADELGATLSYDWHMFNPDLIDLRLYGGHCDVIMGVPDGYKGLITTIAYYRSPYVFVYRADRSYDITSLDDPILHDLDIGLQGIGIPPHQALLARGLADNITATFGQTVGTPDHLKELVEAVASGRVDVGLAWGPVAGYFAAKQPVKLDITPVTPEFEPPFINQIVPMTIGMRHGDESLRDRLDIAIAKRWDDIQQVLRDYGVPLSPLPRPVLSLEGR